MLSGFLFESTDESWSRILGPSREPKGALGEVEPIVLIQVLPIAFDWKRIYSTRSVLYLCSQIVKFAHVSKRGPKDLSIVIEIAIGE